MTNEENQKAPAPKVEASTIDAMMERVTYSFEHRPNGSNATIAHAFLDGTFYIVSGTSSCVSADNYDKALGEQYAVQRARVAVIDKLWELEGYALHKQISEAKRSNDAAKDVH
jgi:hypothetical protein